MAAASVALALGGCAALLAPPPMEPAAPQSGSPIVRPLIRAREAAADTDAAIQQRQEAIEQLNP